MQWDEDYNRTPQLYMEIDWKGWRNNEAGTEFVVVLIPLARQADLVRETLGVIAWQAHNIESNPVDYRT